jgi:hypothetical protein
MGPMHWIHGWGLAYGIYPWGSGLVMEDLMGRHFLGGLLIFSWGGGWGKRKRQGTVSKVGRWTTSAFKQTHFVLYYILHSGSFAAACLQTVTKGVLDLDDLGRHVSSSGFDSPST